MSRSSAADSSPCSRRFSSQVGTASASSTRAAMPAAMATSSAALRADTQSSIAGPDPSRPQWPPPLRAPGCAQASAGSPGRSESPRSSCRGASAPRRRAFVIPAENASSSTRAPAAPQRAVDAGTSVMAIASSAGGSTVPLMAAGRCGTPNPTSEARDPRRSSSFPTAATANTAASRSRAARTTELM